MVAPRRQFNPAERLIDVLLDEQCGGQAPPDLELRILHRAGSRVTRRRRLRRWAPIAAAAAYLLGSWLMNQPSPRSQQATPAAQTKNAQLFHWSISGVPVEAFQDQPVRPAKIEPFRIARPKRALNTQTVRLPKIAISSPLTRASKKDTDDHALIQDGSQTPTVPENTKRSTNDENR